MSLNISVWAAALERGEARRVHLDDPEASTAHWDTYGFSWEQEENRHMRKNKLLVYANSKLELDWLSISSITKLNDETKHKHDSYF